MDVRSYEVPRHFVVGLSKRDLYEYGQSKRKKCKKNKLNPRYFKASQLEDNKDSSDGGRSLEAKMEKELWEKTAEYNKALGEDPCNVDTWLDYVRFQVGEAFVKQLTMSRGRST